MNNSDVPCTTASCPRCDLLFSETLDLSVFREEELVAIQWAANFFNNMADIVLPQTEAKIARQQAQTLNDLLERFKNNI